MIHFISNNMYPKHLVFCGGGTRCLVFVQTLIEMERRGYLKNVREYWGTSAGALLAALLSLTNNSESVKNIMWSANYTKFRNMDVANIIGIMSSWGLDNGDSLIGEIERLFEIIKPGGKHLLLKDISGLNIVVSDMTIHDTVVCNSNTFPDLRVVDAVRASMSLPVFFKPFICPINGHCWVDGAIRAHFPWNELPTDDDRNNAVGFTFDKSWEGGPKTFTEYIYTMIHFDEPKKNTALKTKWGNNIIWFPVPPFPAWFVNIRSDDFTLVENIGLMAFNKWFNAINAVAKKTETRPQYVPPHILVPNDSLNHTTEQLDNPKLYQQLYQAPSQHQSPQTILTRRRWSL
jgi:NTE family protein